MNQAYRKLCEGLPARRAARNIAFPTDPKRVRPWIDALPRANPAQTQRQLADALVALREVRMDGGQRLTILEQLRPVLLEAATGLERTVQGATFPLPPAKARAMEQLQAFEADLALSYRLALVELCAPAGAVPMLRGSLAALALVRALLHRSRTMLFAYAQYQTPEPGAWESLHALYRFAVSHKLEDRATDVGAESGGLTVRQIYAQALLLALSNPYRFSQREQAELWEVTGAMAPHLKLLAERPGSDAFAIPLDRDEGPGYIAEERAADQGELLWLDLSLLRQALEQPLGQGEQGPVRVRLPGVTLESTVELLRRLRAGWGSASERSRKRLQAEHQLDTVMGLSGVHFHLAEGVDFEAFIRQTGSAPAARDGTRHDWAKVAVDSGRLPVFRAAVLDQSLGGYRVRWPAAQEVRARVGELVGLGLVGEEDPRQWMLGVVRWLRYGSDGNVDGGIELLARRARPVSVRSLDPPSDHRPRLRAIQFDAVRDGSAGTLRLVVPSMLELIGGDIEVLRVPDDLATEPGDALHEQLRNARIIESAGDYMIVHAARTGTGQ